MAAFVVIKYSIQLSILSTFIVLSYGAQNIKVPLAANGIKGWISLDGVQDGTNFKFELSGFQSTDSTLKWSIYETPTLVGQEKCWKLKESKQSKQLASNATDLTIKDGKISQTVNVKGVTLADLEGKSLALIKKDQQPQFLACANIIGESTVVFQAKFYGPDIAGSVYFFYNNETKQLKMYSRIINGNNFDLAIKWSLKKYWWLAELDANEPGTLSCQEKASTAYVWLNPSSNDTNLHPETVEMLALTSNDLTPSDLAKSVLVLEKVDQNKWEKSSILGCAKMTLIEPIASYVCNGQPPVNYKLQQKSPFHPLVIITQANDSSSLECNAISSVNISQSANQLDLQEGSKLAFDTSVFQATAARIDGQVTAVAQFVYPIVGKINFYQAKGNPDSPTIVTGWLQSLFDEQMLRNVNMTVMKFFLGSGDLDSMTCDKYKDVYNPAMVNKDFCLKSTLTCPIGMVPSNFTISAYNATPAASKTEYISFVNNNLPLDGPFSIVGQTLQINFAWGKACANITLEEQKIVPNNQACSLKANDDIVSQALGLNMISLVADFDKPNDFYKGKMFMFQNPESTTKTAGLYFKADNSSQFYDDYIWEIVEAEENKSMVCNAGETYNPFGVQMGLENYPKACRLNPLLCAFGDVSSKFMEQKLSDQSIKCIKYLPLSGYFNVQNMILRLRSKKKHFEYSCAKLKILQSSDISFGADSKLSSEEIKKDIMEDSTNSSMLLNLTKTHKLKDCNWYRLTVIAPNSLQITSTLNERLLNSTSLSKLLRSDQCNNGSNASLLSRNHRWITVLFCWYLFTWVIG